MCPGKGKAVSPWGYVDRSVTRSLQRPGVGFEGFTGLGYGELCSVLVVTLMVQC